jgi:outer membrane immunogenic protein
MGRRSLAFIVAVSTIALTQIASAADLPRKAPAYTPPPPPPVYSWTGFYIGLNAGYGWSNANFSLTPTGASPVIGPDEISTDKTLHAHGFVGGGQAGYNFQVNQFVLGIEGDFDYYNAHDTFVGGALPPSSIDSYSQETKQNWLATVRGRFGWAFDRWLVYGTGGLAVSNWEVNMHMTSAAVDAVFSSDETRTGWTAGGGVEFAFDRNWSVKGEYLYADFGHATGSSLFPPPNAPNFTADHSVHLVTQVIRAGINYKFH